MVLGSLINPGNEKNSTQKNDKMDNSIKKPDIQKYSEWYISVDGWNIFGFILFFIVLVVSCIWIVCGSFIYFNEKKGQKKLELTPKKIQRYEK